MKNRVDVAYNNHPLRETIILGCVKWSNCMFLDGKRRLSFYSKREGAWIHWSALKIRIKKAIYDQ